MPRVHFDGYSTEDDEDIPFTDAEKRLKERPPKSTRTGTANTLASATAPQVGAAADPLLLPLSLLPSRADAGPLRLLYLRPTQVLQKLLVKLTQQLLLKPVPQWVLKLTPPQLPL